MDSSTDMSAPIEDFPDEILDLILRFVATSSSSARERKDEFRALRSGIKRFRNLRSGQETLFEEMHVFTTVESTKRLRMIANHASFRVLVRKLIFHRPSLEYQEDLWRESTTGRFHHPSGTIGEPSSHRGAALEACRDAYIYEQKGMDHEFVQQWALAISCFCNLRCIVITGNTDENQLMTLQ